MSKEHLFQTLKKVRDGTDLNLVLHSMLTKLTKIRILGPFAALLYAIVCFVL